MEVKASNYRRGWGKRWRSYRNPCTIRNISFQIRGDRFIRADRSSYSSNSRNYTVTNVISNSSRIWAYGDPNAYAEGIDKPVLLKASADATNKGVGAIWVEVRKNM